MSGWSGYHIKNKFVVRGKMNLIETFDDVQLSHVYKISQLVALPWTYDQYESDMRLRHSLYVVCDKGFINWHVLGDEMEILNVAVHPDAQQKGIGSNLLSFAVNWAKQHDVNAIFLEVRESNIGAKRLYERQQFKQVGIRKKYYRHPVENALVMKWEK